MMKRGDSFDRMFDSFLTHPFGAFGNFAMPFESFKVDIKDNGASYELTADLPGVKKEDISLSYSDNYLTISASHDEAKESGEGKYLCRERSSGTIKRSFYIDNADRDKITASFEDGILKVELPKSEEKGDTAIRIN
jgi:HSP20 family protein